MNGSPSVPRALILSLVLNVFLLGAIAGGAWRWWAVVHEGEGGHTAAATLPPLAAGVAATPAAPGTAAPRGLRFAADGLSAAQRQAFRAGLREARRDAAEEVRQGRDGRIELARLIAAPSFDRAAFDAALSRTRAADLGLRERTERSVADFAATLSPGDRIAFAQGLSAQGNFRVPPPAGPAAPAAAKP